MIKEFSRALQIPAEILYYVARRVPASAYKNQYNEQRIIAAFKAFQRELQGKASSV
jgi:hypothetical protein